MLRLHVCQYLTSRDEFPSGQHKAMAAQNDCENAIPSSFICPPLVTFILKKINVMKRICVRGKIKML